MSSTAAEARVQQGTPSPARCAHTTEGRRPPPHTLLAPHRPAASLSAAVGPNTPSPAQIDSAIGNSLLKNNSTFFFYLHCCVFFLSARLIFPVRPRSQLQGSPTGPHSENVGFRAPPPPTREASDDFKPVLASGPTPTMGQKSPMCPH